jgi:hypothetical protein
MTRLTPMFALLPLTVCGLAVAGPYPSFNDPAGYVLPNQIRAWAAGVEDYSPAPGVDAASSNPAQGLGPADGQLVALGDLDAAQIAAEIEPGSITLTFNTPIVDGPGADFAVFENAGTFFTDPYIFAELAYVEVSSDGRVFARFPSTSLNVEPDDNGVLDANELLVPFGRNFAGLDTTNVDNLAGAHPQGFGTPFDLLELVDVPVVRRFLVDLGNIRYVRLVDIPGSGDFDDELGNPILDTWLTVGGGGFDLDAVGIINTVPEPSTIATGLLPLAAWAIARRWA